jgi:hypothetical protein
MEDILGTLDTVHKEELVGRAIEDWRSAPTEGGPHWYRNVSGRYEMVFVSADLQWVARFSGVMTNIKECRGKFYGPIRPTKYGV